MEGMLELLTATNAAVQALDKSTRSHSSTSSRSSVGSKKRSYSELPDSGICYTEDKSQKTDPIHQDDENHSSDESTTASDVLIRSTCTGPGEKSIFDEKSFHSVDNTSSVSKYSKSSFGQENFNSSGPVKVKVSSKLLREIKSPYESPRDNVGDQEKIQNGQGEKFITKESNASRDSSREKLMSSTDSIDSLKKAKYRQISSGETRNVNMEEKTLKSPKNKPVSDNKPTSKPVCNNPKDIVTLQSTPQGKGRNTQKEDRCDEMSPEREIGDKDLQPMFIERHTPKKMMREKLCDDEDDNGSYIEEYGKEQSDDLDLVPQKQESMEASIQSGTSSQPEIVTVPERIVTISTHSSVSTDNSLSDSGQILTVPERIVTVSATQSVSDGSETGQEDERIPPRLPDKFHQFSKHGNVLRQGSESSGLTSKDDRSDIEEIHVEKFQLSEKQRLIKESFTKRFEQAGPKKRIVQPRIVGHATQTSKKGKDQMNTESTEAVTAAVAASAAIAATQPFLKAQQELENKMTHILDKMAKFHSDVGPPLKGEDAQTESSKVAKLEEQLAAITEQRIQHLEKLQEHQVAMQAKLLSLSRTPQNLNPSSGSKSANIRSPSRSPPIQRKRDSPTRPVTKSIISKSKEVDYDKWKSFYQSQGQTTPLGTPTPRTNAPKPVAFQSEKQGAQKQPKSRGILEEILASDGSPRRDIPEPTKYENKERLSNSHVEKSPAVKRAENLVDEIESVKEQLQNVANDADRWKAIDDKKQKDLEYEQIKTEQLQGPSPLDPYLLPPQKDLRSPYKWIPDLIPGRHNAPVLPGFEDAAQVLQQVKQNSKTLEANLEAVYRARQEAEVYTMMENISQDGYNSDLLRIRKMVDKKVALLHSQVEREVTDEVVLAEMKRKEIPVLLKSDPATQKPVARGRTAARIDTGLNRIKGPSFGPPQSKYVKGKENKPTAPSSYKPPTKQVKARSVFEDEDYMTRVYGKASYQKKRSTVKDPYMHLQNVPKVKPDRPPGAPDLSTVKHVKSSKTQTAAGVRQFYFSPTHGTYIPVTSADKAPIPGQLIPMAVPLGGPRIDGGLTFSTTPSGPLTTSTPASHPPVSALKNVAMVTIPAENVMNRPPEPELGKQVLPNVDIDTDISETSPIPKSQPLSTVKSDHYSRVSEVVSQADVPSRGEVHLQSPQHSPNKTKLEVTYHRDQDEDTLTDVSEEDLSPENAPGIALPGYHPPSPPPADPHQPIFPKKMLDQMNPVTSDVLAEDIRRREALESRAEEWIKQELMARMISQLCPTGEEEEAQGLPHVVDEDSIQSEMEDKEQSMFVVDSIGRAGLQLFVDVGQPVDSDLVNALIREVLVEKVVTMLGQRPDDEQTTEARPIPKLSMATNQDQIGTTELENRDEVYTPDQVETPQPTPKASPIVSPTRVISPPITPDLSPAMSPRIAVKPELPEPVRQPVPEPESEISESIDISEELRLLKQKLVVSENIQSVHEVHDIDTPIATPIPEEEAVEVQPLSPPPQTPREVETIPKVVKTPQLDEPEEPQKIIQPEPVVQEVPQVPETTSPKPWGDPESPLPEENPDYRGSRDTELDQPLPLELSVEPVEDNIPLVQPLVLSTQKKNTPPRKSSPTPSETESMTESSISDTVNQSVSEGQWLLNKSEGEVADFPIDEVTKQRAMEKALRIRAEMSMASTLKDTSDIPDESTEFPISEGEFQYNPAIQPDKDPVLLMLSKLQHQPVHQGQYNMSAHQVSDLLDYTGRSTGELSMNQLRGSVDKSMGEVRMVHSSRKKQGSRSPHMEYGRYDYGRHLRSPDRYSPDEYGRRSPVRGRTSPGDYESNGRRSPHKDRRSPDGRGRDSPVYDARGRRSPGRWSPERDSDRYIQRPSNRRGRESPVYDGQSKRSSGRASPEKDFERYGERPLSRGRESPQQDQYGRRSPERERMRSSHEGKRSPTRVSYDLDNEGMGTERFTVETTVTTTKRQTGRRSPTKPSMPGGVSLGSGRISPGKSALKKPPQATKSPGLPDKSVTMTGPRTYHLPGSDEIKTSQSMSDKGTRAFTPDQMNMEDLIQSGYLSQTFSQSSTGRAPSPGRRSQGFQSPKRLSKEKKSLGLTYSFDAEPLASDSFSESELRRLAASDSVKMSVTLPSTGEYSNSEFL